MHQQHMNCLINTWFFAGLNMAVNSVGNSFLCNNMGIKHVFYALTSAGP